MQVLLIGLNHRTAPVALRERVAFSAEQARAAGEELRRQGVTDEAVVLSTCNRCEIYAVSSEAADPAPRVEQFCSLFHGLSRAELDGCLYQLADSEAARHLYRVAAGLDSMLLGEAEILGQVREAYRHALDSGSTGAVLNRLFQGALEVGKRVRAETEIGSRPMSVASAGVRLAEKLFRNLRGHQALILGAGEMGRQVVVQMYDRGIRRLLVANRSQEHARQLAEHVRGEAVEWEALAQVLAAPDIVVASVSTEQPVVTRAMLEQAMAARGNRPLFLVDLGVPRNVDPAAAGLYNLYLYNIDDLEAIVEQNRRAREQEIPRAEAIIAEHLGKFEAWRAGLEATAMLEELRALLDGRRERFLAERLGALSHLSPDDREAIARLTREMLDNLLEEPAKRLRHAHSLSQKLHELETIRKLFGLDTSGELTVGPGGSKGEGRREPATAGRPGAAGGKRSGAKGEQEG
jgi:glutamyl-tRNA reductase